MNTPFLDYGKSLSQKQSRFVDIGQRNKSFKKNGMDCVGLERKDSRLVNGYRVAVSFMPVFLKSFIDLFDYMLFFFFLGRMFAVDHFVRHT